MKFAAYYVMGVALFAIGAIAATSPAAGQPEATPAVQTSMNTATNEAYSPLAEAARKGKEDVVKYLRVKWRMRGLLENY